jgi:hypothetical protein
VVYLQLAVSPASQKIDNTWFEGEFLSSLWNHSYTGGPRTNNHVEGYHHNNWINEQQPDIYSLINVYKKVNGLNGC